MKQLFLFFFLTTYIGYSQQANTEVFLFDLENNSSKIELKNVKNLSNNEGYDNQPSFLDDRYIVFASTRNGQTDIAKYDTRYDSKSWANFSEGGEYTPLKIPNKDEVSAVRLDKDGKQRLYAYNLRNGESKELINDLIVAYYTWYNEHTIVSAVIEGDELNLYATNLNDGKSTKHATKVGRSFHRIPNSNLVSYISKEDENNWQIKSLDPITGTTKLIANTMQGVEDICWLNSNTILSGKDSTLYKLTLRRDNNWKQVDDLASKGIAKITRLSVNPEANKLLIAGDINATNSETGNDTGETDTNESGNTNTETTITASEAEVMVQKQIAPYNSGDLNAFANAFTENVKVFRFPNEMIIDGRAQLKKGYQDYFKNNKNLSVSVNNRMVLKNVVIDEEVASVNDGIERHVAIYTTNKDGIETMTFVTYKKATTNPEIIVNKQLEAYNKRDLKAFMATYTNDVKLYAFPNTLRTDGQEQMQKGYQQWFNQAKDLKATIIKRFVIGNKVIDYEKVRANGKILNAIAIYEVENGLISKVTFIQ